MVLAYVLDDAALAALKTKLETVPRDQWPQDVNYDACELSVRLALAEQSEHIATLNK